MQKVYLSFHDVDAGWANQLRSKLGGSCLETRFTSKLKGGSLAEKLIRMRKEFLKDSQVTIYLIGKESSEFQEGNEKKLRRMELQTSFYHDNQIAMSGVLGVVLPEMHKTVFCGNQTCAACTEQHPAIHLYDDVALREFCYNYFLPFPQQDGCWKDDDRFCELTTWSELMAEPDKHIEKAFSKLQSPVCRKVRYEAY